MQSEGYGPPGAGVNLGVEMSRDIGELAAALAKAQGEMPAARRTQTNPFFNSKYADLEACKAAAGPALAANGLAVVQVPIPVEPPLIGLTTILAHSSGQWIRGTSIARVAGKGTGAPTMQDQTSGMTYLRRTGYTAITGLVAEGEDDDGARASGTTADRRGAKAAPRSAPPAPAPPPPPAGAIPGTAEHATQLKAQLKASLEKQTEAALSGAEQPGLPGTRHKGDPDPTPTPTPRQLPPGSAAVMEEEMEAFGKELAAAGFQLKPVGGHRGVILPSDLVRAMGHVSSTETTTAVTIRALARNRSMFDRARKALADWRETAPF